MTRQIRDTNEPKYRSLKRYATAAIVLGGGGVVVAGLLADSNSQPTNYGRPINYNGQRYYVQQDSRRAVYPDRETCYQDVPIDQHNECEPTSNYRSGGSGGSGGGGWYGPVYSKQGGGYQPDPRYSTETADSTNTGKQLPKSASYHGFGANGKALTDSGGS